MPSWDPTQYEKFAEERTRPFVDLLSRVAAQDPALVVDGDAAWDTISEYVEAVAPDLVDRVMAAESAENPRGGADWEYIAANLTEPEGADNIETVED